MGLPNSSQKLFLQVAIPIALPDGACGMDEVSNGGFVDYINRETPNKSRAACCEGVGLVILSKLRETPGNFGWTRFLTIVVRISQ